MWSQNRDRLHCFRNVTVVATRQTTWYAIAPPIALGNVSGSGLASAINAGSPNNRKIGVPILRRRRYANELPPKPNSPEQKPMPAPTSISRNQGSKVIGQPIDRLIFLFRFAGDNISIWCLLNWCRSHAGFNCRIASNIYNRIISPSE